MNDTTSTHHHNLRRDAQGNLSVKDLASYWLPDLKLQKVIGGTLYTVTGSYEGTETLNRKLSRILAQDMGGIHDK